MKLSILSLHENSQKDEEGDIAIRIILSSMINGTASVMISTDPARRGAVFFCVEFGFRAAVGGLFCTFSIATRSYLGSW